VEDVCRTYLIASDSSEKLWSSCPVLLDSSGGVGLVCGMKRGVLKRRIALLRVGAAAPVLIVVHSLQPRGGSSPP
jgi:hypothetical protein